VAQSTHYYCYALLNPTTGATGAVVSTINEKASGLIATPAGFTIKRQLKFALRTNASSAIQDFNWHENTGLFEYLDSDKANELLVLNQGQATSYTLINTGALIPPIIAKLGVFKAFTRSAAITVLGTGFIRPAGKTYGGNEILAKAGETGSVYEYTDQFIMSTGTGNNVEYRVTSSTMALSLSVKGYYSY